MGEWIGNYATIAPEMRHTKEVNDARPADVWSLAKTLWMLLTNNYDNCFEGLFDTGDESISIKKYCSDVPVDLLENILKKAIKYDPDTRVNIDEFLELLIDYKECLNERKKILSFRNQSIPAIKVFVRYTSNESKFVTFVLCYNNEVDDFTHGYTLNNFYDMNGNIN